MLTQQKTQTEPKIWKCVGTAMYYATIKWYSKGEETDRPKGVSIQCPWYTDNLPEKVASETNVDVIDHFLLASPSIVRI